MCRLLPALFILFCWRVIAASPALPAPAAPNPDFRFIDTAIENGSPLHWDPQPDGSVLISLHYDHERDSPNRAAGHWHFRLEGRPGARLTLVFQNFLNVWNGRVGLPVDARTACSLSEDGRAWRTVPMELVGDRVKVTVEVPPSGSLFIARLEPYRLSDLRRLLEEIRPHPLVGVEEIGRSAEGRPLEVVRVGRTDAPFRLFIRARAHPWEPGGNWVLQGMIRALLADTPESRRALAMFSLYTLPIANPDGVARGLTRFNVRGRDLNRKWDRPAPADLAPENHALEAWLRRVAERGLTPHLGLDLHNDASGKLHVSRPDVPSLEGYLASMRRFEELLRRHTWFTEGSTGGSFRNPGTLGEGWLERFGVPAAILELNAHWIAGRSKAPLGADWEDFGRGLLPVFTAYFGGTTR
jgi:hypothetical protein